MKFKLWVKHTGTPDESAWAETYDSEEIETISQAHTYGYETIKSFNGSLRPGERARFFLRAEIISEKSVKEHKWEKQNAFTKTGGAGSYDVMKCVRCGVTARRYGLGTFQRDPAFRSNKYENCEWLKGGDEV